jgi:hypothetical protein
MSCCSCGIPKLETNAKTLSESGRNVAGNEKGRPSKQDYVVESHRSESALSFRVLGSSVWFCFVLFSFEPKTMTLL